MAEAAHNIREIHGAVHAGDVAARLVDGYEVTFSRSAFLASREIENGAQRADAERAIDDVEALAGLLRTFMAEAAPIYRRLVRDDLARPEPQQLEILADWVVEPFTSGELEGVFRAALKAGVA